MSTYNELIPLNSDSPGIFPAQSRQNFTRLKTLIGVDHQFNDSAAANDGYHNLVHLTEQAPTGPLVAIGRLYVKTVSGLVQLFYMDSFGVEHQITPLSDSVPFKISGKQNIPSGTAITIFATPFYNYTGYGIAYVDASIQYVNNSFMRSGAAADTNLISTATGSPATPRFQYSGTNLEVKNTSGSAQDIVWSLMINRVP